MLISLVWRLFHSLQCAGLWWHSTVPFNTRENPFRPGISALPTSRRWTRQTSDLFPKHTSVSARGQRYAPRRNTCECAFTRTHLHATNHHHHTQYLLLFHIAVNPVKKLCGEKKYEVQLPLLERFDLHCVIRS